MEYAKINLPWENGRIRAGGGNTLEAGLEIILVTGAHAVMNWKILRSKV
jgi:hypothetical protein